MSSHQANQGLSGAMTDLPTGRCKSSLESSGQLDLAGDETIACFCGDIRMDNEIEIWRTVEGFPDYQVSSLGRVRAKAYIDRFGRSRKPKMRKLVMDAYGYMTVKLNRPRTKTWKVHRLVACAFLQAKANQNQVNHKDFDRTNNAVANLECVYAARKCHSLRFRRSICR